MHIKIILNPWANRGKSKRFRNQLANFATQQTGVELMLTAGPGHAQQIAAEAVANGVDIVAAAGGDGTVHEVVNGMMQAQNGRSAPHTRLAILPLGSGNDLAHALGIPNRLDQSLDRITSGSPKWIDLARIEDENGRFQYVDNNIGIGFDASVVIATESIRRISGFLMYFVATFQTLANQFEMFDLTMQFDEETVEARSFFLACGVGPRGGGGFRLTPHADLQDGLIDSCLVTELSRPRVLQFLPYALLGQHERASYVTLRQNETIRVMGKRPLPIHVDGEMFAYPADNIRAVTIKSVPQAIQVII